MRRSYVRADSTAKTLIAAARDLGFRFQAQDGTLDGLLFLPGCDRVWIVDFKAHAKSPLTEAQKRLQQDGWPISWVWSVDQLLDLRQSR